jgi:predicted AlkP superfamily phosphohydrolase/phosphomutase
MTSLASGSLRATKGRSRVLILGLDGADWDVLRPLADAGRLPHLAAWMRDGAQAKLPSTTPPMSFPAWSSFATGLAPGRHGIFDFTQKQEGAYAIRFVNAADRAGEAFWTTASRAGRRVLCLGVPATYPADRVDGLLVPGFDAPVSSGSDAAAASDPALYARVAARTGPWMTPDLDEGAHDGDWHERAVATLLSRVERKTAFAIEALRQLRESQRDPALMVVVFSESDTVAHHYWRDHDAASPRHDPNASAIRKGAVAAVYERLDAAVGALRDAFGRDAACFVVSDHGQGGASRRVVHLNKRLAECGLLARRGSGAFDTAARRARDLALRVLPPRIAQQVFRRLRSSAARLESAVRFGGMEWRRTAAFSEEVNTQPGVWINLVDREAAGSVARADYERVRRDVIDALLDWKLDGGGRVVARALPREDLYDGPFVARAPDVVLELGDERGYLHSLVATPWERAATAALRTLADDELGGGRGRGMNGTHRRDGIWLATGARSERPTSIAGVAQITLDVLGVAADGEGRPRVPLPYSAEEEARVAARLRALGYLE